MYIYIYIMKEDEGVHVVIHTLLSRLGRKMRSGNDENLLLTLYLGNELNFFVLSRRKYRFHSFTKSILHHGRLF
jgi:hypothetical protein